MAATLHDPRYKRLVELLVAARKASGLSQEAAGERLGRPQSYLGKVETCQRRLDALELFDLLAALEVPAGAFASKVEAGVAGRGAKRRGTPR